jgi:hypothetical protein
MPKSLKTNGKKGVTGTGDACHVTGNNMKNDGLEGYL